MSDRFEQDPVFNNSPEVESRRAETSPLVLAALMSTGLLVTACSGEVDDSVPDTTDAGEQPNALSCRATGSDQSALISEWGLNDAVEMDSYVSIQDEDPATNRILLDYTDDSPNDQSTFYTCEFTGGQNCNFTLVPSPATKYEAAVYYYNQGQLTYNQLKLHTYPENGETTAITTMEPLEEGDNLIMQVVSDPEGNGSYSINIDVSPDCEIQ